VADQSVQVASGGEMGGSKMNFFESSSPCVRVPHSFVKSYQGSDRIPPHPLVREVRAR
jgi:hypothetical protein